MVKKITTKSGKPGKKTLQVKGDSRLKVKSATELGVMAQSMGIAKKAKTHKGRKELEKRAPKLVENPKRSILMKGKKSSELLNTLMRELHAMRGNDMSQLLMRKAHDICPMDDISMIERTSTKYDASLFVVGSHQKKRPHNLVMGRCFDGHALDIAEFGIEDYKSCDKFKSAEYISKELKPVMIFQGEPFENSEKHKRIKNVFTGKSHLRFKPARFLQDC